MQHSLVIVAFISFCAFVQSGQCGTSTGSTGEFFDESIVLVSSSSDCGICPKGTACYSCPEYMSSVCSPLGSPDFPDCTLPTEEFDFPVMHNIVHLDAKKYSKYKCIPPLKMHVLKDNLMECVDPKVMSHDQEGPDTPQLDASH